MTPFPHHYQVTAAADAADGVLTTTAGVPALQIASPVEFGGPGGHWSPETLLVAAAADCFVLTFRGIAAASQLQWSSLTCEAIGTLDRIERATQFTEVHLHARLLVPPETDTARAYRLLEKAEQNCLITKSLKATVHLDATVTEDTAGAHARCA